MWPFRKRATAVDSDELAPGKPTAERLDDLEDAVRHINRRFGRLQMQVTRWAEQYDEDDDDGDEFDQLLEQKRRA